jgi:hypothetical protein
VWVRDKVAGSVVNYVNPLNATKMVGVGYVTSQGSGLCCAIRFYLVGLYTWRVT